MYPFICKLMKEATEPLTAVLQHFKLLADTVAVPATVGLVSAHSPNRICFT